MKKAVFVLFALFATLRYGSPIRRHHEHHHGGHQHTHVRVIEPDQQCVRAEDEPPKWCCRDVKEKDVKRVAKIAAKLMSKSSSTVMKPKKILWAKSKDEKDGCLFKLKMKAGYTDCKPKSKSRCGLLRVKLSKCSFLPSQDKMFCTAKVFDKIKEKKKKEKHIYKLSNFTCIMTKK